MQTLKFNYDFKDVIRLENSIDICLMSMLEKNYKYKNIMIIGLNNDEIEKNLRLNREYYNFVFCDKFDEEIYAKTDVVILFTELIDNLYINRILLDNKDMIIITKNHQFIEHSAMFSDYLKSGKLRLIINNGEDKMSIYYCKTLMNNYVNKVVKLEGLLTTLFFNSDENLTFDTDKENCLIDIANFDFADYIDSLFSVTKNKSANCFLVDYKKMNGLFATFIMCQILLNLYKNFIKFITPNLVGKICNYDFDENKFWFIKNKCGNFVVKEIENAETICEEIKNRMIFTNINFYYVISTQCYDFDYSQSLKNIAENYSEDSLLKIINEMGLLNFNEIIV